MILFEKKDKENNKDYVYRVLRENIMSLALKPGEVLSEIDLSEKIGISRTPLREVLTRLKSEHLIQVKPQSGTIVSLIDLGLVEEALFMRMALEEKALEKACNSFDKIFLIDLEKNLYAQQIIAEMDSGKKEFYKLDNNFHELIFKGIDMKRVWNSISNISTHYDRMKLLPSSEENRKEIVEQHREIISIIKNKELNKIPTVIIKHFKCCKDSWKSLICKESKYNTFFKDI